MNASLNTIRRTLLAACFGAMTLARPALAEDDRKFQSLLHETDLYGVEDVANGRYQRGIERLEKRVGGNSAPHKTRVPALIDLCAAYTMNKQFEQARQACDAAVDSGWYSGYAYNNRGTYNIAIGNYEAAVRDFQAAVDGRGAEDIARANLEYAQERLVAIRNSLDDKKFVASNVDGDVETAAVAE